jgi:hypothetical protein
MVFNNQAAEMSTASYNPFWNQAGFLCHEYAEPGTSLNLKSGENPPASSAGFSTKYKELDTPRKKFASNVGGRIASCRYSSVPSLFSSSLTSSFSLVMQPRNILFKLRAFCFSRRIPNSQPLDAYI